MINEEIRDKELRIVDEKGEQLGIMTSSQAQALADEKQLDLVKIAPKAKPPVARIMDYGKFKFDQAKKDRESRKKQKVVALKEVRLSLNIGEHDLQVRVKRAQKFLENGDKVKVSIRFRGREIVNTRMAREVMKNFADLLVEYGEIDKAPKMEGRHMVMFMVEK